MWGDKFPGSIVLDRRIEALESGIEFRCGAQQQHVPCKWRELKPRGQGVERGRSYSGLHGCPLFRELPGDLIQRAVDDLRLRVRLVKVELLVAVIPVQQCVRLLVADSPG